MADLYWMDLDFVLVCCASVNLFYRLLCFIFILGYYRCFIIVFSFFVILGLLFFFFLAAQMLFRNSATAVGIRSVCSRLIIDKVVTLASTTKVAARIVNIMSNDLQRICKKRKQFNLV